MLATLLVPWPRPRLSSDRAAIASPSRCCLLISNASCGLGGFACAAHAVRKMSLPSPQSRRTYAGLRSWSLDRHQRPMHVLRSRCHVSVPFDQRHRSAKERMVRTLPRDRGSSLAAIIAAFCNNIGTKRTCRHSVLFVRFRGDCVAKLFCPSERAVALWQRVRRSIGKPRKVTRKKPAKNAMPSASERPFQSFLSLRASEIHWPSGWSLRTSLIKLSGFKSLASLCIGYFKRDAFWLSHPNVKFYDHWHRAAK